MTQPWLKASQASHTRQSVPNSYLTRRWTKAIPKKRNLYWTQWRCCTRRRSVAWKARYARSTVQVAASGNGVPDAGGPCVSRVSAPGPPGSATTTQLTSPPEAALSIQIETSKDQKGRSNCNAGKYKAKRLICSDVNYDNNNNDHYVRIYTKGKSKSSRNGTIVL